MYFNTPQHRHVKPATKHIFPPQPFLKCYLVFQCNKKIKLMLFNKILLYSSLIHYNEDINLII